MQTLSDLKFIVVGSGASGTGFMHKLLCNCGIQTGHEDVAHMALRYGYDL